MKYLSLLLRLSVAPIYLLTTLMGLIAGTAWSGLMEGYRRRP